MPSYDWTCHVCSTPNAAGTDSCARCGSDAVLSGDDIERLRSGGPKEKPYAYGNMRFPSLLRRYAATAMDTLTLLLVVYAYSRTPLYDAAGLAVPALLAVTYEPLLTARWCTLGQALMHFRVRRALDLRRISLPQAYGRAVLKYSLGIISFITLPARRDRRAIHDLAAGTIVIEAGDVASALPAMQGS